MFLFGHTFVVPLLSLLFCLLAEGIRRIGKYQSGSATMLSYAVFSLWPCNSLMQMLLLKERYMEMVIKEMGENYGNAIEKLLTAQNMAIVYVCTFLFGLLGAFLGRKLLKKHFEKAGIVKKHGAEQCKIKTL
jgi:major facilitator superfamily permease